MYDEINQDKFVRECDKIIADIKLILKEKYLLEIVEENPLKLKEI